MTPGSTSPTRHPEQNGGTLAPALADDEGPKPTVEAERDRRIRNMRGLTDCPGPGDSIPCTDSARVLPGKLCQTCRSIVGREQARQRKRRGRR